MSTSTDSTISTRAALAMLANDLIYAGAIGAAAVIAYRPSADAEGFADATAFLVDYARLNGPLALTAPCWALSFHLIEVEEE